MIQVRSTPLLPVLLALLVAGCAAAPARKAATDGGKPAAGSLQAAQQKLQQTPSCCDSFSDFSFKKALPAKPKPFELGPGQPVADFNGSRSYFLAFRLPEDRKLPYRVLLKSKLTGGRWLRSSYLFAPSIVLLDARFQPLDNRDVGLCEYIGWTDDTTGAFGSLTVDNPAARYMVVYSSGAQLSGSTYWEQSPTAFSADAPVKMASAGSFQIPHGPDGVLYVGLLTSRYKGAIRDAICGKPESKSSGVLSTWRKHLLGGDDSASR